MGDCMCFVYFPLGLNVNLLLLLASVVGWAWQVSFMSLVFIDVCHSGIVVTYDQPYHDIPQAGHNGLP